MNTYTSRSLFSILIAFALFVSPALAQESLTQSDKEGITEIFNVISASISDSDADTALRYEYLSPNASDDLEDSIFSETPVTDSDNTLTFTNITEQEVKINSNGNLEATYTADRDFYDGFFEKHYKHKGNTFVFEKVDGDWYLLSSNYYEDFRGSETETTSDTRPLPAALGWGLIAVMAILVLLAIALFVFWVWMLIEAIKRKGYPGKGFWILALILFSTLAAIVYYFAEHRPYKKSVAQVSTPAMPPVPSPIVTDTPSTPV